MREGRCAQANSGCDEAVQEYRVRSESIRGGDIGIDKEAEEPDRKTSKGERIAKEGSDQHKLVGIAVGE